MALLRFYSSFHQSETFVKSCIPLPPRTLSADGSVPYPLRKSLNTCHFTHTLSNPWQHLLNTGNKQARRSSINFTNRKCLQQTVMLAAEIIFCFLTIIIIIIIIIIKSAWKVWGKSRHCLKLSAEVTDSIQASTIVFPLEIAPVNVRSVLLLLLSFAITDHRRANKRPSTIIRPQKLAITTFSVSSFHSDIQVNSIFYVQKNVTENNTVNFIYLYDMFSLFHWPSSFSSIVYMKER